jgi:uncharacterized protein
MKKYYEDSEYLNKVNDILENKEFQQMELITHHEGNRLDHSIRVSYYSYKLANFLKLDSEKVARAGLLHDFFFEENCGKTKKTRTKNMFKHPEYALENALKYFNLSPLEKDIIISHMFPVGIHIPKYFESWIVDFVDDIVAIYEESTIIRKQLSTATCFILIVILNSLR